MGPEAAEGVESVTSSGHEPGSRYFGAAAPPTPRQAELHQAVASAVCVAAPAAAPHSRPSAWRGEASAMSLPSVPSSSVGPARVSAASPACPPPSLPERASRDHLSSFQTVGDDAAWTPA